MTEILTAPFPGAPLPGPRALALELPRREPAQERYLRGLRIRMIAMTVAFVILLAHNRFVLGGAHFTYVLLPLINLLDDALMYYLTWRGFMVEFQSYLRLAVDAFALAFICHLTGSVSSAMPMAYVMLICATALTTDRAHTYFSIAVCTLGYWVLLLLEFTGTIAYAPLAQVFRIFPREEPLTMATNALFVPTILVLSGVLVSHLADRREKTEERLRAAHGELTRASGELVRAERKLHHSEKLASLGTLVAGVAHELNNPIGFVQSNLQSLEEWTGRLRQYAACEDPEERARLRKELRIDMIEEELPELISDSREGTRRAVEIVAGLKDFSRPSLKRARSMLLEEIIDKTLRLVNVHLKNRIRVTRAFALNEPVNCYPGLLSQVLTNLLINAAQAIQGEGAITIETGRAGEMVFVRVSDSGPGIAPEKLPHIFDPFFTTKEPGQGTGLGLSVSYGIVAEMGGRIEVESPPGKGARFSVLLPKEPPALEGLYD